MSLTLSPPTNSRPANAIRGLRVLPWLAAGALLLAEYLLTSLVVDIRPLAERSDWLAALGSAGSLGPMLLAVTTATLVLGGRPFLQDLRLALEAAAVTPRSRLHRVGLLALHLAGFAAFFSLTLVFSRATRELPPYDISLAAAWLGSGLIASLALGNALLPLSSMLPLVRRLGHALLIGGALGFSAWAGGVATLRFWEPLGVATLYTVAAILRHAGPEVWYEAATATLGFEDFTVAIAPVCSGYEGIGLLTVLAGAYLWAFRATLRFPNVLAIIPIGIGLAWAANVVRIAALMLVGARWSPELALGSFHSKAGWVLFCGIALGLVTLTQRAAPFSRNLATHDQGATWNPTAAYLTPLLALVAVRMATDLFTIGLPLLYPLGASAGAATLWWRRGDYPWLFRPTWSWGACGLGVAAFVLWVALEPAPVPGAADEWRLELALLPLPTALFWLSARAVGSVVIVPLAEELAFRGYLLRRLVSADFTSVPFSRFGWVSFLISSTAFGLLHERWLAGTLTGMLFALAQYRRGRLSEAVLAHGITNLLLALYVIGWQQWSLWM